jgi:hypothetical protein
VVMKPQKLLVFPVEIVNALNVAFRYVVPIN